MTVSQIMKKMIAFLVGHHHTFTGIDNVDWQILVEADYGGHLHHIGKYSYSG
jgi:hypothetical protein